MSKIDLSSLEKEILQVEKKTKKIIIENIESDNEDGNNLKEYKETIQMIKKVAKDISVIKTNKDGRIDSAIKEGPFLEEIKTKILKKYPNWNVIISPPRASCDIMINGIRINLKLTDCKSADNSVNKPSIYYSITGLTNYPYSSTWNEFYKRLVKAKGNNNIKMVRDKSTEYHYLVKNKINGDVLFKSIFDIHTYISNPSNDLQINWKNEFENIKYKTRDDNYLEKVKELILTIQKSVKEMISRTKEFADADIGEIFREE